MIRLFLPERVSLTYVGIFAAFVFVLQQLEHTALYFSACSFLFIMVAAIGFNFAGGLTRPSGGYLFFFATIALIVALVVKIFLGQPADSNLIQPHLTITVYLVGMLSMTVSAYICGRFRKRRPLLGGMLTNTTMERATIGCLVVGTALTIATQMVERGQGTALSALFQINRFLELAIILNTIDVMRRTGGRRTIGLPGLLSGTIIFTAGLLAYSKESMFTPFLCWLVAAASQGVVLNRGQVITGVLGFSFMSYFLVPYSQYGRTLRADTFFGNIAVAQKLLSNLPEVRRVYEEEAKRDDSEKSAGYFGKPMGILDRTEMISPDDELIDATDRHGPYGYVPIIDDIEALVPHVIWADKPAVLWGNVYAHEAGVDIPEDDFSTGISFSPVAEGFHLDLWTGLLVLSPAVWTISFLLFDSLCGEVRDSPWGLLTIIYFAHVAPEAYLGGLIYADFYFAFAISFAAITVGYIMPLLGSLFIGPGSKTTGNLKFGAVQRIEAAPGDV